MNLGITLQIGSVAIALVAMGCASVPASPFNELEQTNINVTAFRLQNYEPPATASTTTSQPGLIPGLPTEIATWIQQGAQGLQQLIPPGLLPQGLGQTGTAATTSAQTQQDVPRFSGFRILGQTQVLDSSLKADLAKLFGTASNFETPKSMCLYPEFGLSFGGGQGVASRDMVVSFSCSQVAAKTFPWPHPTTGMKADTAKQLSDIVRRIFPQ